MQALAGTGALEFGHWIAAPCCISPLADCDADVVKIEPPRHGDAPRISSPLADDHGTAFLARNPNQHSIGLDLTVAADRQTHLGLFCRTNIVVDNSRPRALAGFSFRDQPSPTSRKYASECWADNHAPAWPGAAECPAAYYQENVR
jgi:crotonobetainyl-CoA:carnitine CoA-transferase CaiB-like acyl-CoA transferase